MEAVLRKVLDVKGREPVAPDRSRMMSAVRGRGNRSTEWRLRAALVQARIRGWRLHAREIVGVPDVWFPTQQVAIFVDGCFWHGCRQCGHYPKSNSAFWRLKIDRNRERDSKNNLLLRKAGVRVIRIWEHEVQNGMTQTVTRIRGVLRSKERASNPTRKTSRAVPRPAGG